MATARDFVSLAMKEAGVLGVGQTALPEDINDCFTLLNRMLATWQKKRWLVPFLYEVSAVGNSAQSNQIGPGKYYNAARPDKIQAAYFRQIGASLGGSNEVSYPLIWIPSWEDYAQIQLKKLNSWPQYFFYDGMYPFGNVYIWPIPDATYEIHLVIKGPVGFTTQIQDGVISANGAAYTNGIYDAVPLQSLSGFGSGATAKITVAGNIVSAFELEDEGDGYRIGDAISANSADIGGTGAGFIWTVNNVTDSLDSEFTMPPEYEEGIHYNLCRRITSMYQYPPNLEQVELAKQGLRTIRNANTQIPLMKMPPGLRFNRGSQFYIFNADAR